RSARTHIHFPYTTLFRSQQARVVHAIARNGDGVARGFETERDPRGAQRVGAGGAVLGRELREHVLVAGVAAAECYRADDDSEERSEEHTSELQSRSDLVC